MGYQLLLSVLAGIGCLLLLVLYFRLPAFVALLVACIVTGLLAGLGGEKIIAAMQEGVGGTLGFVAPIVGLGAIFGALLEKSGGAVAIAMHLIKKFGEKNAPLSLAITGFIVAIPVFFEVGFILLVPVIYAVQKRTGHSLLLYAIPLLAGIAFGHAFIPPTPGPIAVAKIVGADIGHVIFIAFLIGLPTVFISGLLFGKYIASKIHAVPPAELDSNETPASLPSINTILSILLLPILLICISTLLGSGIIPITNSWVLNIAELIGHPFTALIIANLLAWYVLGLRRGVSKKELFELSTKSLSSVGAVILVIGAGGAFKQILVNTGAGKMIAETMAGAGLPVIVFAFAAAAIMRILQGSATVAMITSAGLAVPFISAGSFSPVQLAAIVSSIAAGATILSHVNDGGFWLIKQYLGLTEKQTFRSWTLMTTVLAFTGFGFSLVVFYVFGK